MADPIPKTASLAELVPAADDAGSTRPAPTAPPSGRYALGDEIARGGMGVVHRAVDTALGREVAVKVLHARFGPSSGAARRFADEARITARLQHPNIPAVHDLGALPDGRPFLAMKLIQGDTLDELVKARPDPAHARGRFVAVFEQIGQAVAYAHSCGVIHRDLKPANVMVGAFGEVQVMDWGLAKAADDRRDAGGPGEDLPAKAGTAADTPAAGGATRAGVVVGTPGYLSPEQAAGAVDRLDARTDVFGLGSILCVLLTGSPPHCGATPDMNVALAALGRTDECFARLDASGADPELVALCKRCLATRPEDRPADGGAVAREVAALRQAADERARRAELDKVTAEGEVAAAAVAAAERRKRRRVWVGAAAALAVAVVGGLGAVLVVQDQARREVEAKNVALADEQAKVEVKNAALEAERAKVEQRFEMARKSIATFHTVITGEKALENDAFKDLRKKLLTEAAGFYRELETLLAGEADPKSRVALADGLSQLGLLTEKIGDKTEALAVFRRELAIRQKLADAHPAVTGYQFGLANSHRTVGLVLSETGNLADAIAHLQTARDILHKLSDAYPAVADYQGNLALTHLDSGTVLFRQEKRADAQASFQTARDILHKLSDAHPAVAVYQGNLALTHLNSGTVLSETGNLAEALTSFQTARGIFQKLVEANPALTQYQSALATCHRNIGVILSRQNKRADALASFRTARDILQKLADGNPAVTQFQHDLAWNLSTIGFILSETSKKGDALASCQAARDVLQKLVDANPSVTQFQYDLALSHNALGIVESELGKWADALASYQKARDVRQRLASANPDNALFQHALASSYSTLGRMQLATGKWADALASYENAWGVYQKLVNANPAAIQFRNHLSGCGYDLALCYVAASRKVADKREEYAVRAVEFLRKAIAAGSVNRTRLDKDTDLDPIRDRVDFKQLLADLEANAPKPPSETAPPPRADK